MSFQDWIEKLRAKPVRERERIAVVATGISFFIVLLIWLLSFSEINKDEPKESASSPISDQLEELKKNISNDKQSIQDMMESFPQGAAGLGDLNSLDMSGTGNQNGEQNQNQNVGNNQESQEMPQLP